MRRALPLSVQLLLTLVLLLVGVTAVLTRAAYTSLRTSLETEAARNVDDLTRTHEQAFTQLFQLRQQRAEGFLASVESLCAEPTSSGRLAWVDDCARTMVNDFRKSERALGALLRYRNRTIRRSGRLISGAVPAPGALAAVVRGADGAVTYVTRAAQRQTALTLLFDDDGVAHLFRERTGAGGGDEVMLVDDRGEILAPQREDLTTLPADRAAEFLKYCRSGDMLVNVDYRGVKAFQSFRRARALGTACIAAFADYDATVAPAERLRADLVTRGAWFVLVGVVLSLVAAQWISSPVRRLAASARKLQTGRFDRPIPLAGPSEVRALGRAFNAMGNDLAELVAKEQAARRVAEQANRSKDEFLATVSHELRTPLNAILGWAQMLRSEKLAASQARHGIEVIERNARAQSRLIEDLLDVSRIVSNRLRLSREPVELIAIVQDALDSVRPQAAAKQIEIDTITADSALVLGDPRRLEQVIWNLAWNAVKFTQPSGRVTVQVTRTDRHVTLTVTDTGVGISSSFLPHVFDWFRQEDARARSQAGLGLGLGIVRHLVQLHGGKVHAESRGLGQGATFTVTLPIYNPPEPVLSAPRRALQAPIPIAPTLQATRVLVVEDDEDTREIVRRTLQSAGALVEVAATADDARREMFQAAPDVLISDIRMPEEDGYSLIRSLRAAGIETPAIALTAYARDQDADEAHAAGFQVHLTKPIDATHLVDAVASVIRPREAAPEADSGSR
jgi:signal transduction histidine kinase/ActR/RegA family two-component response regulator